MFRKLRIWALETIYPDLKKIRLAIQAHTDEVARRVEAGESIKDMLYTFVHSPELEWDQALQAWTILAAEELEPGEKLILGEGRGGAPFEECFAGSLVTHYEAEDGFRRYSVQFP